jgi:hypothetical protein
VPVHRWPFATLAGVHQNLTTMSEQPTRRFLDIEAAIRASWSAETCDPDDLDDWHSGNPSRGQCGVTALVLNDLLGGDLLLAEVTIAGTRRGYHYWNILADGAEVDLTRAQFDPEEVVGEPTLVKRPPGPVRRCAAQYALLSSRVLARLASGGSGAGFGEREREPGFGHDLGLGPAREQALAREQEQLGDDLGA